MASNKKVRVLDVEQGSSEWLSFREGRITGTKLGKLFAKSRDESEIYNTDKPLLGFYQLMAERLATGTGDDDDLGSTRERGHDLEPEAVARAEVELGLKLNHGKVWQGGEDWHIASPDAWTDDKKTAVEIKCLSSARHLQALAENIAPKEYFAECLNYFIVNSELNTLYLFLYDNRFEFEQLQVKWWEYRREDYQYEIERLRDVAEYANEQANQLAERLLMKGDFEHGR